MSQPSIIGVSGSGNTRAYTTTDSGNTRVFSSVSIPANANTVIVLFGIDTTSTSTDIITSLAIDLTGAVKLHDLYIAPNSNMKASRLGIFDVRACGAATSELTAQLSGTNANESILGVVCTDGYVESFISGGDRFETNDSEIRAHSGNIKNNILVYMMNKDADIDDFSFTTSGTGVTELFKTNSGSSGISTASASQATASDNCYTIAYTNTGGGKPMTDVNLLISSQPNAFGDIDPRGDIISHDIITN